VLFTITNAAAVQQLQHQLSILFSSKLGRARDKTQEQKKYKTRVKIKEK
jgi:hypothetical protein